MGTTIRAELSKKNKYYLEKHRYYELKHFCLQYPIWKKRYSELGGVSKRPMEPNGFIQSGISDDPTARQALSREYYSDRIEMVEKTIMEVDPELSDYILKAVTEGASYEYLKARLEIPCCRDSYYERYREFFWMLDKIRG